MSAVTIEITQKGVFDQHGRAIPVGTSLTLDKEPTGWINKYRLVNSDEGKALEMASPAPEPEPATEPTRRRGRPRKRSEG